MDSNAPDVDLAVSNEDPGNVASDSSDVATKAQCKTPDDATCEPASVTNVPPSSGPHHGVTSDSTIDSTSNCTPSELCSRPFVLTSTDTYPAEPEPNVDELHTSADSLTYDAADHDAFQPHSSKPADSAEAEKPLPSTVTGVPPSAAPRDGLNDDTDAAARYVNDTPLAQNCWPFIDTDTKRPPMPVEGGDAHSSWPTPTYRAAAVRPLDSNRQRNEDDSTNPEPSTATRVPPTTGPADGASELTCMRPCT